MKKIWRRMEIEGGIEKVKKIGRRFGKRRKMAVVRMADKKEKMEVMSKKRLLKGEVTKIEDDWTRKERVVQWRLEKIARKERRNNREAWVRYGKIWMEGK